MSGPKATVEASGVQGSAEDEEATPPRQQAPACEQCGAVASKYRCPGCGCRTCSLACVNTHKTDTGCSGKRDRTAFVGMKEFDDKALLSDFRLLEEIGRADDVARRCRPPAAKPQLPAHLASLVYQGSWRSVKLLIMPPGMAKRKANTTRYDARNRTMFWRVEWRFPGTPVAGGSGCIECVDERVDEKAVVGEVLAAHLRHPAPNYVPLRPYAKAGLDALRVFMRKEKTPANAPAYFPIDTSKPLASQLASRTIIEYPVFIVALPHEAANYPPPAMLQPPPRPAGQQPGAPQLGTQGVGPSQAGPHMGVVQPPPPPPPRRPQPQQPSAVQLPLSGSGTLQSVHPQVQPTAALGPAAAAGTAANGPQGVSHPDHHLSKRPRVDGAAPGAAGGAAAGHPPGQGGAGCGTGVAPVSPGLGAPGQGASAAGGKSGGPPLQDENEIEIDVGDGVPEGLVFYYGDDSEEEADGQPGTDQGRQVGGGQSERADATGAGRAEPVGGSAPRTDENEIALDDL